MYSVALLDELPPTILPRARYSCSTCGREAMSRLGPGLGTGSAPWTCRCLDEAAVCLEKAQKRGWAGCEAGAA